MKTRMMFKSLGLLLCACLVTPTKACPEKCLCEEMKLDGDRATVTGTKAICHMSRLTAIPSAKDFPKDLLQLDMSRNELKRVDVMDTMSNLRILALDTNDISVVEPEAFDTIQALESLDLSHNNISELPETVFAKLTQLRVLRLNGNNLRYIREDTFVKNTWLEELQLGSNPLIQVHPEWFSLLNKLTTLDLSQIKAYALQQEVFHYTLALKDLDLSGNEFTSVPTLGIRSAQNLRRLVLNNNPIKQLTESSFSGLKTLEQLEIRNMPHLVDIMPMTFSDLCHLVNLTISENPELLYVDRNAFYGAYNSTWFKIKTVDLRGNRLNSLSQYTLPWCQLDLLDLRQNPWRCDCHFEWTIKCKPVYLGARCAEPTQFRGIEVHRMVPNEFVCRHHPGGELKVFRLFVILFGSIILFFLGLGIILVVKRHELVRWWSERKRGTGSIYYVKAHSNPGESPDM